MSVLNTKMNSMADCANKSFGELSLKGNRKVRIWELDFLRGFTILLMVCDHFMYDLSFMFSETWIAMGSTSTVKFAEFACKWWDHGATWVGRTRDIVQTIAICIFFGLCGGSTAFSRNNASRALKTLVAASVITLGTYLATELGILDSSDLITFGVLHMLGVSTIIVAIVYALCMLDEKNGRWIFIGVSAVLAGAIFGLNAYLDTLPMKVNPWLMGLHERYASHAMRGGDYFPLLPNLGIVFAGAAIINLIYYKKASFLSKIDGKWNKPICFVGRHTILIVIVHQVLNVVLLMLITGLFIDKGNFVLL